MIFGKKILFFLFASCLVVAVANSAHAQKNLMHLNQDAVENMVMLDGTWQFHYGELLSAEQMDSLKSPQFVVIPSTWNEYEGEYPSFGVATYYLKVIVDGPKAGLALNARITGLNYRLFANGLFLGELGKVGFNQENSVPRYQNIIYNLPDNKDTLRLVYHVSNFHYRKGGMWRAPFFGTKDVLKVRKEQKLIIDFFLMGAIIFMGVYHLALSIFRRKNKLAFYFALVCFFTAIRSASVGEFELVEYLDWSWFIVTRIEFISFFLLLAFMSRFIYYLFPDKIPKNLSAVPYYFGITASIATIFIPIYFSSFVIPIAQLITLLIGVTYLFFIGKEALKGNREEIVAFVGLTVLFGASVFEILMHHARLTGDVVFAMGIFLYLFSHVIIIAYRSNKDYQKTELLSEALQSLNTELEVKVQQRTSQLDKRNEELERVNENLQRINAEKDGILHVVAHDLKSPLNSSIGLSEVIRNSGEIKNEKHLKYLGMLEHINKQGLKFINDLLVLYQFEDTYKPSVEKMNVNKLLQSAQEKFEQIARKKSIKFNVINQIEGGTEFLTDPDMVSRIMDNLLSNAFKYSFADTTVTLSSEMTLDGRLKIVVEDQGQGIPEVEHEKIFKKFQKISTKPTGQETSSGLGLSIVKQLVDILEGDIGFESQVRKGTTFWFVLPELPS